MGGGAEQSIFLHIQVAQDLFSPKKNDNECDKSLAIVLYFLNIAHSVQLKARYNFPPHKEKITVLRIRIHDCQL